MGFAGFCGARLPLRRAHSPHTPKLSEKTLLNDISTDSILLVSAIL